MSMFSFIGQARHTMDDKGRILIPKPYRSDIDGNTITSYVLTISYEPCLCLFPRQKWLQIMSELAKTPPVDDFSRYFLRKILSGAVYQNQDKIGRIMVPQNLRDHAELDSEVFIIGVIERIELWDVHLWESYDESNKQKKEELSRRFIELGF